MPTTKYTYNYNYVPPLAMVDAVSPAEGFAARPEWIHLVSISALKILFNSIMIGVRNKGNSIEFVPGVLQALNAVAQLLGPDTKRDLSNAIARELGTQGSPTTEPELKVFLEGVIETFAKTLTLENLLGIAQSLGKFVTVFSPVSSLEDYKQLFQLISLPAVSQNFQEDAMFAAMRVAGPNPLIIERMKALDARLPITEEQYQSVMGTQDSLEKAVADGRLYLADYSVFDGALNGSFPAAQKFNYAPLALFAVPAGRTVARARGDSVRAAARPR